MYGVIVKLKKVPFKVKLFKLIAKNGDIDWVITNDLDETLTTQVVEATNNLRWKVEGFHREFKHLNSWIQLASAIHIGSYRVLRS